MDTIKTKICSGNNSCGLEKSLEDFYSYTTRITKTIKLRRQCKDCYIKLGVRYERNKRKKDGITRKRKCIGICGETKLLVEFDYKCTICKLCKSKGLLSQWISNIKNRTKKKGWQFDITTEFIRELYSKQNGKCAVTKIPFTFNPIKHRSHRGRHKDPFSPSIDRIDSSRGYTKDNIRLVCVIVNLALNEFGDQIFSKMCTEFVSNANKDI